MTTGSKPVDLVKQLVGAENNRDAKKTDRILSARFVAITRANGHEEDREKLLRTIADPPNPNIVRHLKDDVWDRACNDLTLVRSIAETEDRANPQGNRRRFRNIHVFEKQEGEWLCTLWQVTELT